MSDDRELLRSRLEVLYKSAADQLFQYARLRTGPDRCTAETLVQEVFKAAWIARKTLFKRDLDGQRAWLFDVLRRKIADTYRRGAGRFEATRDIGGLDIYEQQDHQATPSISAVLRRSVLASAWDVIKEMPPVRREVLYLRAHEWKTSEIAEHLRITTSTVRDHISAGRRDLNKRIGPTSEIFDGLDDDERDYQNGEER